MYVRIKDSNGENDGLCYYFDHNNGGLGLRLRLTKKLANSLTCRRSGAGRSPPSTSIPNNRLGLIPSSRLRKSACLRSLSHSDYRAEVGHSPLQILTPSELLFHGSTHLPIREPSGSEKGFTSHSSTKPKPLSDPTEQGQSFFHIPPTVKEKEKVLQGLLPARTTAITLPHLCPI